MRIELRIELHLILIGHGNVARRFESLLAEQQDVLARDHGLHARIVGIATRHRQLYDAGGLRFPVVSGVSPASMSTLSFIRQATMRSGAAARRRRLVVIETTTLDIDRGSRRSVTSARRWRAARTW